MTTTVDPTTPAQVDAAAARVLDAARAELARLESLSAHELLAELGHPSGRRGRRLVERYDRRGARHREGSE